MILTPVPVAGSPDYQWSRSRLMFSESSLILPGFTVEAPGPLGLLVIADVYWRSYDPHYVTPPDSSAFSVERRGSLSVFDLGGGKRTGDLTLSAGVNLQYYSEEWLDPLNGDLLSIDSLAAGPFFNVSCGLPVPYVSTSADMGVVFPEFGDVQGWIDISFLFP